MPQLDPLTFPTGDGDRTSGTVRFSVTQWGAWAPGLESPDAWCRWARGEATIGGEGEPQVAAMPPMLRRRAGRLGRMALEAAYACTTERGMIPSVFCSRHGNASSAAELLTTLARNEALSPAVFSLSVHNAIGGLFSIAAGSTLPFTAIAGGVDSVASGVIEACGLLADGVPEVLLVVYDESLPAIYRAYRDEMDCPYAWSWRMAPATGESFSLTWGVSEPAPASSLPGEPLGLEVFRFFLSGARERTMRRSRLVWHWGRHA